MTSGAASQPFAASLTRRLLASTAVGVGLALPMVLTEARAQSEPATAQPEQQAQPEPARPKQARPAKTQAAKPLTPPIQTAQAQPAPAQSAQAQPGTTALPEVKVQERATSGDTEYRSDQPSMNKLTQPLRETPQSITVIPKQMVQDLNATTLRDVLRYVPGVSLQAGEGGNQGDNLTIRGFNARNDIFIDGMRDYGSYYRDTFNYERTEVLKGAGAVLFGRGSTGGVVNQVSKTPLLDSFYAGGITIGTDSTKRITGDINTPISGVQGGAFRLNVMGHDGDVAGRDVAEVQRFGFAPSVALGLGTPTRITLSYFHQSNNDIPDYGVPWLDLAGQKQSRPADVRRENFYGFRNDYLKTDVDVATAKFEHDLNDAVTLRNQFRYGSYSRSFRITEAQSNRGATGNGAAALAGTPFPANQPLSSVTVTRNQLYGKSQETFLQDQADLTAKFKTGFFDHTLVLGVEGGKETSDPTRRQFTGVPTTNLASPNENQFFSFTGQTTNSKTRSTGDTMAFYALDTIKLLPQLDLMVGGRFDRFDAHVSQLVAPAASYDRTDEFASYRTALVYKPVEIGSVYFSTGTSYNPSAESFTLTVNTAPLPPEKNQTYEVGTKWDVLGQNLSVRGAIFRVEKENARVVNPADSTTNILGGNYIVDGFEVEASGRITERWQIFGGYSYMDGRVESSPRRNEVGNHLVNAPDHTLSLFTTYTLPWYNVVVGGGVNYVSQRYASQAQATQSTNQFRVLPGYYTFNLMAAVPITDQWSVQANVYNLTDELYYDAAHPSHVTLGAPQTVLFSTNLKF